MFIKSIHEKSESVTKNGLRFDRTINGPINVNFIISLSIAGTNDLGHSIRFVLNNDKDAVWQYKTMEERDSELEVVMNKLEYL